MRPTLANDYIVNEPLANSESFCHGFATEVWIAKNIGSSDHTNIILRKFRPIVFLARHMSRSATIFHVLHVLFVCSCIKMVGITARPVVAGMKNEIFVRDEPVGKEERNTVRKSARTFYGESVIPAIKRRAQELPTGIVFANRYLAPESVNIFRSHRGDKFVGGRLGTHERISFVDVTDPDVPASRVYSLEYKPCVLFV